MYNKKICCIVCEFNPFHSGHKYLIEEVRKQLDKETIMCGIMSGNFVQRAEPAIFDKYFRTSVALKNGFDLIVELPLIYAIAEAKSFALGAVKIIKDIKASYIAMGCETENFSMLKEIAKVQFGEDDIFKNILKQSLKSGMSYPSAYTIATSKVLKGKGEKEIEIILKKPNNLLCIEYLKEIMRQGLNIIPIFIKRIGSDYNENDLHNDFSSAMALREKIIINKVDEVQKYLINQPIEQVTDYNLYKKICLFNLRSCSKNTLAKLYSCNEGIENKLYSNAVKLNNLNEVLEKTKNKRFTFSRLKRLCLQAVLGIDKDIMIEDNNIYFRLLGGKKEYLNILPKNTLIRNKDIQIIKDIVWQKRLDISKKGDYFFDILNPYKGDAFYQRKPIII